MVTGRPSFPLQLFDLGVCALNKQHSRKTVSAFLFYIRITLQPQRPIGRKENIRKTLFGFYHEGSFPNVHNWICLYRVILVFIFLPSIWVLHFFFRYTPAYTPLAIQELDEKHLGTFSFRTREGVLQVCLSNNPVYNCIKIALNKGL